MTQSAGRHEEIAREIIYKDDFFKQYADIVPEVGEKLERYVFDFAAALDQLAEEKDQHWSGEIAEASRQVAASDALYRKQCEEINALKTENKKLDEVRTSWLMKCTRLEADLEGWRKAQQEDHALWAKEVQEHAITKRELEKLRALPAAQHTAPTDCKTCDGAGRLLQHTANCNDSEHPDCPEAVLCGDCLGTGRSYYPSALKAAPPVNKELLAALEAAELHITSDLEALRIDADNHVLVNQMRAAIETAKALTTPQREEP